MWFDPPRRVLRAGSADIVPQGTVTGATPGGQFVIAGLVPAISMSSAQRAIIGMAGASPATTKGTTPPFALLQGTTSAT